MLAFLIIKGINSIRLRKYFQILLILWLLPYHSNCQSTNSATSNEIFLFSDFFSGSRIKDTIPVANRLDFYNYFKILRCQSGNLYFSGNGFSRIILFKYYGVNNDLKGFFERCVSGSKITFENCTFERDGGLEPVIINREILFR